MVSNQSFPSFYKTFILLNDEIHLLKAPKHNTYLLM